jgi:hypothetical protein
MFLITPLFDVSSHARKISIRVKEEKEKKNQFQFFFQLVKQSRDLIGD